MSRSDTTDGDTLKVADEEGTVPLVLTPTLREISRHIADRNNLGPLDSPASLGVAVFARQYIKQHSEDFEREREDVLSWSYRGTADADPLPWSHLEYAPLPEPIEEILEDEGDDTPEDTPEGGKTHPVGETADETRAAEDDENRNMTFTLDLSESNQE